MKTVKAKFRCEAVVDRHAQMNTSRRKVKLHAVAKTSTDRNDFSNTTPVGKLRLVIEKNTPAHDFFQPGKEYRVTIEEATE